VKRLTTLVFLAILGAAELGCGGPAIGDLKTITLSSAPSANLVGEGGTVQLAAMGTYSSGAQRDITTRITYTVTPIGADDGGAALMNAVTATCTPAQGCGTVSISSTGLVTAIAPFVCTWVDMNTSGTGSPAWAISGSYQVTATAGKITSQPVFISVASAAGAGSTGKCGP